MCIYAVHRRLLSEHEAYVKTLIGMKDKFDRIIHSAFGGDRTFYSALNRVIILSTLFLSYKIISQKFEKTFSFFPPSKQTEQCIFVFLLPSIAYFKLSL